MSASERLRLDLRGAVQGVGFRPFVYRLAHELEVAGWVRNDSRGVVVEVEGPRPALEELLARLPREKPAPAVLHSVSTEWLPPTGAVGFRIEASDARVAKSAVVLPDLATCPACRAELFAADDRRVGYPFTNCTHCGPRFSIVLDLPYDRPATTMRGFAMCPACRAEYEEPRDRRFHAQPNACPVCGPHLSLHDAAGALRAEREAALEGAAAALARGEIVALKGLGGYQLLVDARDAAAVARLRARKRRPVKPLALMVRDLAAARVLAAVSSAEAELLASREAPIVLLARRPEAEIAAGIAPGNSNVGLMLPTSPLHHLLLARLDFPIVATSGNLADEPIAIDDAEARARLGGIADLFLAHDRPIARHVDDSVAWLADGAPQLLRRARGYAPLPVRLARPVPTLLAVGAHQKDAVALALGDQVFLSQHIGDMETPQAQAAFARVIADFLRLYDAQPVAIAHDLHPDYPTTRWARAAATDRLVAIAVQHHHAHLAACLAEHRLDGEALGFTWDGTGYGADGTVWGGEALLGDARGFRRIARLRPFRLPGGEAAVREPRRVALALLWQLPDDTVVPDELPPGLEVAPHEQALFTRMLADGPRSPWTSSAGRLFDGVAALLGLGARVSFEGEAAMALEFAADPDEAGSYPLPLVERPSPEGSPVALHPRGESASVGAKAGAHGPGANASPLAPGQEAAPTLLELDWRPLLAAVLADRAHLVPVAKIAARFHNTLVDAALAVARAAGVPQIALSGGCFQNRLLTARLAARLRDAGFAVLIHREVPPNDGGIALGQVAVAAARLAAR